MSLYFPDSPSLSVYSVSQMKESNSQDDFKIKVQLVHVIEVHSCYLAGTDIADFVFLVSSLSSPDCNMISVVPHKMALILLVSVLRTSGGLRAEFYCIYCTLL